MDLQELRKKSIEELRPMIQDEQKRLGQLRFDLFAGKVKNVKEIRQTRRRIARLFTLMREISKK